MTKTLFRAALFVLLVAALSIGPAPTDASACGATYEQISTACNDAYNQEAQVNQCIWNLVRHYCN